MAETSTTITNNLSKTTNRNYQIDFLKFICTICVFFEHTKIFLTNKTRVDLPMMLGPVSVHFFFIISGLLMVSSISKHDTDPANSGKNAMQYVIKKFKGMSTQYWTALFMYTITYLVLRSINNALTVNSTFIILERIFPEAFLMTQSGVLIEYNNPTWYISAMMICMLPLAYMLYKRRDLFLYVVAPLTAIFTFGYMYQTNNFCFFGYGDLSGVFLGGIIRGMCGLCFGAVAWLIYNKLLNLSFEKKSQRILITVVEGLLWLCFFTAWFCFRDAKAIDSVLFVVLPIAVAIAFSRKSYISKLFGFRWMKVLSSISLAIYLNHWLGRYLVLSLFPDCGYKFGVSMMAAFTVGGCVIYYLLIALFRFLWNKKIRKVFYTNP